MPRFKGEYRESVTVDAPLDVVRAHFRDLETIATHYGDLQSHEIVDDSTIRFVLLPKSEKGVTFHGAYTAKYETVGDNLVTWKTLETKNMWSTGQARFTAVGGDRTRVDFEQRVETEMQVNALLGKIISPIVSREITNGAKGYLARMCAAVRG